MAKKILIIDDDKKILRVLIARLTVHGFEIESASDGKSGFEKARKSNPDVILLDVTMPGWNGIETANKLKENLGTADIPIIFLTGLNEESISRQYLENGNCYLLQKPFRVEELLDILANELGM